jgi:hypothetical protein
MHGRPIFDTIRRMRWLITFTLFTMGCAAAAEPTYLGLSPPDSPRRFEPLAGRNITQVTFAPDLRRVVVSTWDIDAAQKVAADLYESRRKRGEWTAPVLAQPLGRSGFTAGEAWFAHDGQWLYFSSNRPPASTPSGVRAFRSAVRSGSFLEPRNIAIDLPAYAGAYYPRLLANGDLSLTCSSRGPRETGSRSRYASKATSIPPVTTGT